MVVLTEKGKPTRVLQGAGVGSKNNEMTFNSLDFNDKGEIIFAGDAKVGEKVRIYINNLFVGEALADQTGRWALNKGYVMQAGENLMRFDQVDVNGEVISRRETFINMPKLNQPLDKVVNNASENNSNNVDIKMNSVATTTSDGANAASTIATKVKLNQSADNVNNIDVVEAKSGRAIIIWGDNLWNISRKLYGRGELYTTIFKANKDQIRDPNLIYPGQVFILPDSTKVKVK